MMESVSELIGTWIDGYISVEMTDSSHEGSIRNAISFILDFNVRTKPNNCSRFTAQKLPVQHFKTFFSIQCGMVQEFLNPCGFLRLRPFFGLHEL